MAHTHDDIRALQDVMWVDVSSSSAGRMILASMRAHTDLLSRSTAAVGAAFAAAMDSSLMASEAIARIAALTIPRWHFPMLNDTERNNAFARALRQRIEPGAFVLDIGAGTGLLAMMAARAGAGQVVTCETNPMLAEIATRVVAAHGMADVITVLPKSSTELRVGVDLARPVDMVVCEIVDCGLVGEGLLPSLRHAREQLLRPGGELMPTAARLRGFLVESEDLLRLNRVSEAGDFDVRLLNVAATRGHFPVRLRTWPYRLLTETVELASFDLLEGCLDDGSRSVACPAIHDGLAHALVAWFEMELAPGIVLCNPPENVRSHWMQALVILDRPQPTRAGQTSPLEIRWEHGRLHVVAHG